MVTVKRKNCLLNDACHRMADSGLLQKQSGQISAIKRNQQKSLGWKLTSPHPIISAVAVGDSFCRSGGPRVAREAEQVVNLLKQKEPEPCNTMAKGRNLSLSGRMNGRGIKCRTMSGWLIAYLTSAHRHGNSISASRAQARPGPANGD
jgi:hypothetical protein